MRFLVIVWYVKLVVALANCPTDIRITNNTITSLKWSMAKLFESIFNKNAERNATRCIPSCDDNVVQSRQDQQYNIFQPQDALSIYNENPNDSSEQVEFIEKYVNKDHIKDHIEQDENLVANAMEILPPNADTKANNNKRRRRKKKKKKKKKRKKKNKVKDKQKRRKKKKQQTTKSPFQEAHVIFANQATVRPNSGHHHYQSQQLPSYAIAGNIPTTAKPSDYKKKIKYILRKTSLFKKKKKQYLQHLGHVIYPFIKFVVFFTVLNPFTLSVFLFSLVSPIVFGGLGFMGLSLLVKPVLNILFAVKRNVGRINRYRQRSKWRQQQYLNRRPITIHKHYYQHGRAPYNSHKTHKLP